MKPREGRLCRQGHRQSLDGLCCALLTSVDCLGVSGLCPSRAVPGEERELGIGLPHSITSSGPVLGSSSEVSRSCRSSWCLNSEARRESLRCGGAVFHAGECQLTTKLQAWEGVPDPPDFCQHVPSPSLEIVHVLAYLTTTEKKNFFFYKSTTCFLQKCSEVVEILKSKKK